MHTPVLLKELIYYLDPKPGDAVLDATLGGGGHAQAILRAIGEKGKLIGIEQDAVELEKTKNKILETKKGGNVIFINGNFRNLSELLEPYNVKKINGAIFDLGMSSMHLEESGRGFTFQKSEPLVMTFRSDPGGSDLTAGDIVNKWSEEDIIGILKKFGQERYAKRIARNIANQREKKEVSNTLELVEIIRRSVPAHYRRGRVNCATKTFQALRMAVNDELDALSDGLKEAWEIMSSEGRIAVISFHSLEDRIVKNFFKDRAKEGAGRILTKKPINASASEKRENPRSRSAKLRAIEKI